MKNKDIKIIFVDIDWTILDHKNHRFDIKSIKALKRAQKRGVKVFICTARPFHSVSQTGLFNLIKPDGCVYANGAMVTIDNKVIYKNIIPLDVLYGVAETTLKYNLTMECTLEDGRILIAPKDEYVDACFSVFYEEMPEVGDYHDKEVVSILLFAPKHLEQQMKEEMPKGVEWARFHDSGVDVYYKKHTKADGVKVVLDHYGYLKENSMSFGDDYGDIPMFESTGISVCMNNGKDKAKEYSSFTTKNVWESGVKYALKLYKII